MGLTRVNGRLESSDGRNVERRFLVDTGSFYSAIGPEVRKELSLPRGFDAKIQLADGRIIDTEVVLARLFVADREGVVPVEIIDTPEPLIGVSALEALGLRVNPMTRELEHDRPFGPPPAFTRWLS